MTTKVSYADRAIAVALRQVGKPYVFGDEGPDSFDCSGLLWYSYKQAGAPVGPRWTTATMAATMQRINVNEAAPGDFLFPHTGHVVMVVSADRIVEALKTGVPVRTSPRNARTWRFARRFSPPGKGMSSSGNVTEIPADVAELGKAADFVTDTHNWLRLGYVLAGGLLVTVAVILFSGETVIGKAGKSAVSKVLR